VARDVSKFVAAEKALWSRHGITPTERRVKLRAGNEVRIQQVGDGPPIVFIHGVSVAGSSWVLLADALRKDFTCLLVDRPGCGLSDPLFGGPNQTSDEFKQTADELAVDILDGLGLGTAPVACTSLGGFFGLRTAIANPDRITKVVSYSWAMGTPMTNVPMMMRLGSLRPMKALMARMPISAPAVKMMFKQVGMERAIETGTFDDDMIAWSIAVMKHTETLRNEMQNNPFITLRGLNPEVLLTDEELAKLQSPVLLLWGEEDTNAGEPEGRAFAARLPNATLEIVREAGHTPWIDELDFCANKTRAFLIT